MTRAYIFIDYAWNENMREGETIIRSQTNTPPCPVLSFNALKLGLGGFIRQKTQDI